MVQTGDIVETTIRDVAFGGDGVGIVNDLVIFVPFAVEGDRIRASVTGRKKTFARGEIREILEPSPHRVEPACPYFGRCGGCRYQHVAYLHQLEIKEKQVREVFARIGGQQVLPVAPIEPSPKIFHYRGKAEYHIDRGGPGGTAMGFISVSGSGVVDIRECMIVDDSINRRSGEIRKSMLAGERSVCGTRLVLWSGMPGESGEGDGVDSDSPAFVVRGAGERRFLVPFRGFFQANQFLVEKLARQVVALCSLTGRETVLDAYCGSGLFSLFALTHAGQVFGIEEDEEAVRCAQMNLGEDHRGRATFFPGDVARVMDREFGTGRVKADVVILDPPRTGCSRKVLDALVRMKPLRIVYVSCNPATQARDCRYLTERGFSLRRLQPIDMFPQTGHIEVIGLLERRAG